MENKEQNCEHCQINEGVGIPKCANHYTMENKDWREEFGSDFKKFTGDYHNDNYADWWLNKIESLLRSKQEEIEKAIEKMPNATRTEVDIEKVICADDLKPITSNILK